MPEDTYEEHIDCREVTRKGGSLGVTLPKKVKEYLKLQSGDTLEFYRNKNSEICIKHVDVIYKTPSGLEFSLEPKRSNK